MRFAFTILVVGLLGSPGVAAQEPVQPTVAPLRTTGAPASTTPNVDPEVPVTNTRPPSNGVGMIVGGSCALLGGGMTLAAIGLYMDSGDEEFLMMPLSMGIIATIGGSVLVGAGIVKSQRYKAWQKTNNGPPVNGLAYLAVGSIAIVTGLSFWGNILLNSDHDVEDFPLAFTTGGLAMAMGLAMLVGGAVTHSKYSRWYQQHHLSVSPYFLPNRSAGLGVGMTF